MAPGSAHPSRIASCTSSSFVRFVYIQLDTLRTTRYNVPSIGVRSLVSTIGGIPVVDTHRTAHHSIEGYAHCQSWHPFAALPAAGTFSTRSGKTVSPLARAFVFYPRLVWTCHPAPAGLPAAQAGNTTPIPKRTEEASTGGTIIPGLSGCGLTTPYTDNR
jgi:hypothetical protein